VAVKAIAVMRTQLGQQGDKLEHRLISFVQIVKPGLKAGQDA